MAEKRPLAAARSMLGTTAPPQRAGAQESGASSGRPVAEAVAGGAVEGSGCGVERRRRGRSGHPASSGRVGGCAAAGERRLSEGMEGAV